ncbi:DUF2971 domain-containing protein [Parapedobacter sp. SGR-10]|uniref:DUF2971 domain-containing protein n=1 Tax=Parapedobacter sp. SGR-10 TaxID=2710879 RepID=UPI0013D7D4A5|nr:DUF2971 domain-containing protein [Parapedobacter sp. SGR-10]NGF56982.1 DUF2971 domain-containing protein [Parapedobacter sp. SGR-10]
MENNNMLCENLIELNNHLCGQPINYKYYGADTALTVLTKDTLQFSHPSVFNDPFDCNVNLFEFNEEEIKQFNINTIKKHKGNDFYERFRLHRNFSRKPTEVAREEMKKIFEGENLNRGVTCFSKNSTNLLMWAHYADNHTGVCIGYDLLALREHVTAKNKESCLLPVDYQKKITPLKNFSSMDAVMAWFRTKNAVWRYEEEIRLISRPLTFDENNRSCFKIPTEIIKEVQFGFAICIEKKKNLITILKSRYPHVKLYDTKPDYNTFTLTVQEFIY